MYTYRKKIGSVLVTGNQVGHRLGGVATRLGNDSAVDRLGGRSHLLGVLGHLDTTGSSLDTHGLRQQ
jgi:hypothetical protein